ncbi:hypothetical protein KIH27_10750 [Mycobacterium sp. M1]|uniref:Glycine-rich domain-containing protein n=1 Tax=Mycolicibacter acidiphilus TaxID=2835306 RepID=A0ABS5RID7_9MYCO|nr:hypothetical protein [Mycolicibacter acidiphilus]MBS9534062.1 hypothetical protein [Mycolicibacter acidiphilus]
MTSPIVSDAFTLFDNTITAAVNTARALVNTAPTGGVQSGIDFGALGSADLYFLQVGGDVGQVFAQDFEAVIMEVLTAGILASSIVTNIESGIAIGAAAPKAVAAAATPAATSDTVSSVLAQAQQAATAALTAAQSSFSTAKEQPLTDNLPSGNELQVLGGHILFQQAINTFLNSLPASVSGGNESNAGMIATLQNLLLMEQNVVTILSEIDTNNIYEQPVALTGLNVALVLTDAAILTDVSLASITYALWALEGFTGELVTVNTAGAYSVPIPAGTKYMDIVLIGGAGGGGGYNVAGSGTGGDGGATTATPTGGSTLTAAGGIGGASSQTAIASAGASAGTEFFDGRTYTGGTGGALGYSSVGGNGTAPGGGGGGGASALVIGGQGGAAGQWAEQTLAVTADMTEITGTIGEGGIGGASSSTELGGNGAIGAAFFYFYN